MSGSAQNQGTGTPGDPFRGEWLSEEEAQREFVSGYDDSLKHLGRFNLAILGDTGVGKSSLVNAIFGQTRADTGIGAPVTKEAQYHLNNSGTFGVWDFEGFEHGTPQSPLKTLQKRVKTIQRGLKKERIHVAWFCWDASSARVTQGHRDLLQTLADADIPVIAVLTKTHTRDGVVHPDQATFGRWIEEQRLPFALPSVFPTAALADPWGYPKFGLQELLEATVTMAPAAVSDAARVSQQIDNKMRADVARRYIAAAASTAAGVAATPLPVASALVLAPIQLAMFGKICSVYGLSLRSTLGGSSMLFQLSLQLSGRAAAQSLVKFVPGAGSLINASVAAAWTAAAGEAWRMLCEQIDKGTVDPSKLENTWKKLSPTILPLAAQWIKKPPKWLRR